MDGWMDANYYYTIMYMGTVYIDTNGIYFYTFKAPLQSKAGVFDFFYDRLSSSVSKYLYAQSSILKEHSLESWIKCLVIYNYFSFSTFHQMEMFNFIWNLECPLQMTFLHPIFNINISS